MTKKLSEQIASLLENYKKNKTRNLLLVLAAILVVGGTAIGMSMPAATATAELVCGQEEHTHSDSCYSEEQVLTCEQEEADAHVHTDDCYVENQFLTCGQEEGEDHTHGEECYTTDRVLVCGSEETEGHAHTDACYTTEQVLTCGQEEHIHDASCYEQAGTVQAQTSDRMTAEVSYEAGVVHQDTYLTARKLEADHTTAVTAIQKIEEKIQDQNLQITVSNIYDLKLQKNDSDVEPDGTVSVKLTFENPVSADAENISWKFYHLQNNGNLDDLTDAPATVIKTDANHAVTEITFETDSFSAYVLVGVTDVDREEATDNSDASIEEKTKAVSETEEDNTAENSETDTSYPAQNFSGEANEITVEVSAEEGALPQGTTMAVTEIQNPDVLDTAVEVADVANAEAVAVDIAFYNAQGEEIEPQSAIHVTLKNEVIAASDEVAVVHVDDANHASVIAETEVQADDEISFESDSFSAYVLVYTVDFYFGDYEYHLQGGERMMLSELLAVLQIQKNAEGDILTVADVQNLTFSNEAVVQFMQDGEDWIIESLQAFDTEECLILELTDGNSVEIQVTDNQEQQVNFEEYITKVDVKKIENGKWVSATSFKDDDEIDCEIYFTIEAGKLSTASEDSRTIYYQLPDGIQPKQFESGRVKFLVDGVNQEVGNYSITEDGLITVIFDESYINNTPGQIQGNIGFDGSVENHSQESTHVIDFGGDSAPITVITPQERNYDINTQKTGSYNADSKVASYTVTTSTTKGTEGTVTIEDVGRIWQGETELNGFTYDENSLQVIKIDSEGNQSSIDITGKYNFYTNADGEPAFKIENLPALNENEKYVTTYNANISVTAEEYQIKNVAVSTSGEDNHSSWHTINKEKDIKKEGSYDKEKGLIHWTITLNSAHKDVSGWSIYDESPYKIVSSIMVKGDSAGFTAEIKPTDDSRGQQDMAVSYTFGDLPDNQKTDKYYIEYDTEAPDGNGTVTNTVTVNEGGGKTSSETGTVKVEHRTWGVTKNYVTSSNSPTNSKLKINTWNATVTIPEGEISTFTYKDEILNAVDEEGNDLGTSSHYATVASLKNCWTDNIQLKIDDSTIYFYHSSGNIYVNNDTSKKVNDLSIIIQYFDENGNEITDQSDNETPVKSFTITVQAADQKTFHATRLGIYNYQTFTNTESAEEGTSWTIKNKGSVGDKSSEAEHTINLPKRIRKQVFSGIKQNELDIYNEGTANIAYDAVNGILTYRLFLYTTKDEDLITVVDQLPMGAIYVENSLKAFFYKNDNTWWYSNYKGDSTNFYPDGKNSYLSAVTKDTDNGQELTIQLKDYKYGSMDTEILAFSYQVSIQDDIFWKDLKNSGKAYTNTATWVETDSSAEQKSTVTRDVDKLSKEGKQLKDENGNPTNTLQYYLTLNPLGADLVADSDVIILSDNLQLTDKWIEEDGKTYNGIGQYNPVLDLSSVHLYTYDAAGEHGIGEEISRDLYTLTYNPVTTEMQLEIPDGVACVLTYQYNISNDFTTGLTFCNNATLGGKWSTHTGTQVEHSSSHAGVESHSILVNKVDSKDYLTHLPGVTFNLSRWDHDLHTWISVGDYVTDKNGQIVWDELASNPTIKENKLYRLKEISTIDGYKLSDQKIYFVYMSEGDNQETAKAESHGEEDYTYIQSYQDDPDPSYAWYTSVRLLDNKVESAFYIPNESTQIEVKKVWTDADGVELTSHPDSATVDLYRVTEKPDGYHVTIKKGGPGWESDIAVPGWSVGKLVKKNSGITLSGSYSTVSDLKIFCNGVEQDVVIENYTITCTVNNISEDSYIYMEYASGWAEINQIDYEEAEIIRDDSELIESNIVLNKGNNWTYQNLDLDAEDSDGNPYYYYVEETSTYSGYSISYINNGGISAGQITVNNQKGKNSGFELPKTGGIGTKGIWISGFTLTMIALFLSMRRYRFAESRARRRQR